MALADTLTAVGTAALTRSGARPLDAELFSVWPGAAFAASVLPVQCVPGDNLAIHVGVAQAASGSALVVDTAGTSEYGYVDEILAVAARVRGLAGIVIDGCVRDVAGIARCELPVVATGVAVREPGREAGGAVGREIRFGGTTRVRRGDWVVADDDGTVVLPRARATAVVTAALEAVERERTVLDALSRGQSTLDVLNLDPSRVTGWEGEPDRAATPRLRDVSAAGY